MIKTTISNSVERRLQSTDAVRDALLAFAGERHQEECIRPEDIQIEVLEKLNRKFGFGFEGHAGRLVVVLPDAIPAMGV